MKAASNLPGSMERFSLNLGLTESRLKLKQYAEADVLQQLLPSTPWLKFGVSRKVSLVGQ